MIRGFKVRGGAARLRRHGRKINGADNANRQQHAGPDPNLIRPFRRLRRDRNLFHRPRHRRAAPPPQEIRSFGHYSAAPGAVRSRRGHVAVR